MRYIGVDLARLLAVIGMMANHLIAAGGAASPLDQQASEIAMDLTSGIAAALFAVLGGVSAVFASKRALTAGRPGAAIASLMLRGLILIVLGLALGSLMVPVIVVLAYYGLALIIVSGFIAARSWGIALTAAALWIVGGPLNALARDLFGTDNFDIVSPSFETLAIQPLDTLRDLLVTGTYPATTWAAYLLVGMLVGRALLGARGRGSLTRVALAFAALGALLTAAAMLVSRWTLANLSRFTAAWPDGTDISEVSWRLGAPASPELWAQLIAAPHSGSPAEMLRTIGIALAVIGLLVALCDSRSGGPGRLLDVFRAAGAAPLTAYTLHLLATAAVYVPVYAGVGYPEGYPWWVVGLGAFGLQCAGVVALGWILSALDRRGPLEALTSGIVRGLTRT